MPDHRLDILDVFAEAPLAGNQLAVVRDASQLTTERMQAMALEMNYSETTFVVSETSGRARVRIFTPTQELPFAGHPTLGTAWLLGRQQDHFTLELDAGDVRVDFENGIAWMSPPPIELHETHSPRAIAKTLGIEPTDIDGGFAPQRGSVGIEFLFVGLRSVSVLENLEVTLDRFRALPCFALFAFATTSDAEIADYRARMFFESGGLREDPATGSANSIFAAYLMQSLGPDLSVVVDQGVEMGRPSRIYLEASGGEIRVGGKVQSVVTGEWTLSD
jgi:trans-2,3-dihydro-3-hydroxyanthranilate isomerase